MLSASALSGLSSLWMDAEVFFVLAVWPLFPGGGPSGAGGRIPLLRAVVETFLPPLLLTAIAFPVGLVCGLVSDLPFADVLGAHVLVLALGAAARSLFRRPVRNRIDAVYFAGLFLFAAVFPFLGFLLSEQEGGGWRVLEEWSPFQACHHPTSSLVLAAGCVGFALLMTVATRRGTETPSAGTQVAP